MKNSTINSNRSDVSEVISDETTKENSPEKKNSNQITGFHSKSAYRIPIWFILSLLILLSTCEKDDFDPTPNLKSSFGSDAQIVRIGKVIDGLPYLDEAIIPNLIEGIKKEELTYQRLFPHGADYHFDKETLQLITYEQGSGKFFLIIRGFGDYKGDITYFTVSYTITTDMEYITNVSFDQDVCSGDGCDWCEINHIGNTPSGCKACSNPDQPNGKCNHMVSRFNNGTYLIIPIDL